LRGIPDFSREEEPIPAAQSGWYADPENASSQRYCDGQAWTPHRHTDPIFGPIAGARLPATAAWPHVLRASYATEFSAAAAELTGSVATARSAATHGTTATTAQAPDGRLDHLGVLFLIVFLVVRFAMSNLHRSDSRSPEDQIRAVVETEMAAWNKSDFSYNSLIECSAARKWDRKQQAENRKNRADNGTAVLNSVTNIQVNGDKAAADARIKFEKQDEPITGNLAICQRGGPLEGLRSSRFI
jgi:hypothetical protein